MTTDTTSELPIGHDSFVAQALSDICTDEGIDNELILATDPYKGLSHTTPHRLVVREGDVPAVRQIVADRFPELLDPNVNTSVSRSTFANRRVRLVVGAVLAVFVIVPLIVAAVGIINSI